MHARTSFLFVESTPPSCLSSCSLQHFSPNTLQRAYHEHDFLSVAFTALPLGRGHGCWSRRLCSRYDPGCQLSG
ncbi:expressed unknown protein [Ectocarpus siliculosus]|uniref:Uncharacterized protein n=1 Tax=Ectocarpus siliculosus TaxID=2880 RepID=D7G0X6_ECTSI|nr:expressed unknown protein [Ectocarpus siliculosus]|eukprot:CBJ26720.1 expressed unknown protein [Ectocarpus siliculosus]